MPASHRAARQLGMVHDYFVPFSDLVADAGIPVILYDPLGNGLSTHLHDKPTEF